MILLIMQKLGMIIDGMILLMVVTTSLLMILLIMQKLGMIIVQLYFQIQISEKYSTAMCY